MVFYNEIKIMLKKTTIICWFLLLILLSCDNGQGNKGKIIPNIGNTNSIAQTNPSIMVFPSDAYLKRIGCINEFENQGIISYSRDYNKAFIEDEELKFIISSIEESFSQSGYPLESLEQLLKQRTNEGAMDEADNIIKDQKTLLMNTARPDFIIEVSYDNKQDPNSRNPKKILNYTLSAIDMYTNKVIASITRADITNGNEVNSASSIIKKDLINNIPDFENQIKQRFADEITNGVEINLRLTAEGDTKFSFGDECLGTENYNDWVNKWLKANTVKSTYKPIKNTEKELRYTNVRIMTHKGNGERYTAYDFANDLKGEFSKSCGVKASNKTQGIGDAYLIVSGLR